VKGKPRSIRTIRWLLSAVLILAGISATWAWGEVAQLAPPDASGIEPEPAVLYATWQPAGADRAALFRSYDAGATWQPLALPGDRVPTAWAADGVLRLAVATGDGTVLRSEDRGDTWSVAADNLSVQSLAWDGRGGLYLGTAGYGLYHLGTDGTLRNVTLGQAGLASASIRYLALAEGRLYAATPTVLFYSDDGGGTWTTSQPLPEGISSLAAVSREQVYAGTEIAGVYRSDDGGQTWTPAVDGLGLAAGQMVRVTALQADPKATGVLYAAVDHVLGGTQVHASAAGTFVTLDGGGSWQPLAGPAFPEAEHASALVVAPGSPLTVQAITAGGPQAYAPDVTGALAALADADAGVRTGAARLLGLARAQEADGALLAALADPDPGVSLAAAEALGRIADPATAGDLLVALEHPAEQVRVGAARALGMMGVEAAVPPLRALLLNGEGLEIAAAGRALGRIGSPAAIDALLAALADPAPTGRQHAALAALESLGEPAVAPLVALLEGGSVDDRQNAAQALGWIGSPAATEALARTLRNDRDPVVRQEAAWALGEIGDPAGRAALVRAQARDTDAAVQAAAAWSLARIPAETAAASPWFADWAPVLNRLQPLRWLVLGLSLAGAAWLAMGERRLSLAHVVGR
jgi:HEAT repeat protein